MKTKLFTISTLAVLTAALTAHAAAGAPGTGTGAGTQPAPGTPGTPAPNPGQNPTLLQPGPILTPNPGTPGQASGMTNNAGAGIATNQFGIGEQMRPFGSNQLGIGSNSLGVGSNQFSLRTNAFATNDLLIPTSRTNARSRILQNPPAPPPGGVPITQPPRQ